MANEQEHRVFWIPCCYYYLGWDEDQFKEITWTCDGFHCLEETEHEHNHYNLTWNDGHPAPTRKSPLQFPPKPLIRNL